MSLRGARLSAEEIAPPSFKSLNYSKNIRNVRAFAKPLVIKFSFWRTKAVILLL